MSPGHGRLRPCLRERASIAFRPRSPGLRRVLRISRCDSTATSTTTSASPTRNTGCSASGPTPPGSWTRAASPPAGSASTTSGTAAIPSLPNPVLVGMHLASITKNLRMGQSACILPDHHPIRLAEDLATADQLTGGVSTSGSRGAPTAPLPSSSTPPPTAAIQRPTTGSSPRPWTSCRSAGRRMRSATRASSTPSRCRAGRSPTPASTRRTPSTTARTAS